MIIWRCICFGVAFGCGNHFLGLESFTEDWWVALVGALAIFLCLSPQDEP